MSEKIKKTATSNEEFDFGYHKGDKKYIEVKKEGLVRKYRDGCKLQYKVTASGEASNWKWLVYQHQ